MIKKLLLLLVVASILLPTYALKPKNVSAEYLTNYMQPFQVTGNFVQGTARYKELAAPWVVENSVGGTVGMDPVVTQWYVDGNKADCMELVSTWDGFAADVTNMKVYQTIFKTLIT